MKHERDSSRAANHRVRHSKEKWSDENWNDKNWPAKNLNEQSWSEKQHNESKKVQAPSCRQTYEISDMTETHEVDDRREMQGMHPQYLSRQQSQTEEAERLVQTATMLREAFVKCDEILRYKQLIALIQAQEEAAMAIERLQVSDSIGRERKEVH